MKRSGSSSSSDSDRPPTRGAATRVRRPDEYVSQILLRGRLSIVTMTTIMKVDIGIHISSLHLLLVMAIIPHMHTYPLVLILLLLLFLRTLLRLRPVHMQIHTRMQKHHHRNAKKTIERNAHAARPWTAWPYHSLWA